MKSYERLKLLLSRQEKSENDDRILFYDIDRISAMTENDELSPEESGFMQGYMDAETRLDEDTSRHPEEPI